MKSNSISLYGQTQKGNYRPDNQDIFMVKKINKNQAVLCVADGVGGEERGKLAASMAVNYIESHTEIFPLSPEKLDTLTREAGHEIMAFASAKKLEKGMGTTLTVVAIDGLKAAWSHVGDSRIYHSGKDGLVQITRDHRFIQELIDGGEITFEEAMKHPLRNLLDQCVGSPDANPEHGTFSLSRGDLVLLTTDGLHDHVSSEVIHSIVSRSGELSKMADLLIRKAAEKGSKDNLCTAIARIE